VPDITTSAASTAPEAAEAAPAPAKRSLGTGPGRLLVTLYGVFTVAAASRSLYQVIAQFPRRRPSPVRWS
jgi:hypothetical protein